MIQSRLNGDFLDLKGLSRDPGIKNIRVDFANRSFVAALFKLVRQHMPQVRRWHRGARLAPLRTIIGLTGREAEAAGAGVHTRGAGHVPQSEQQQHSHAGSALAAGRLFARASKSRAR